MTKVSFNIFIQARMSSSRFPGKMLVPVNNVPLIQCVVERVQQARHVDNVVVLTSVETSDDDLAIYAAEKGYKTVRGDLDNVFKRFQKALEEYPCDYFVRVCGDSPIIDPNLISAMIEKVIETKCDFLSNVQHKKFPKGQSVEIICSDLFASIDSKTLTADQQEHVMPYFYEHADQYRTCFPDSKVNNRHINTCIDTPEDLFNIESGQVHYQFEEGALC